MSDDLIKKGMQTRRSVLGDKHVDNAEANKTDFDRDFQEYTLQSMQEFPQLMGHLKLPRRFSVKTKTKRIRNQSRT